MEGKEDSRKGKGRGPALTLESREWQDSVDVGGQSVLKGDQEEGRSNHRDIGKRRVEKTCGKLQHILSGCPYFKGGRDISLARDYLSRPEPPKTEGTPGNNS